MGNTRSLESAMANRQFTQPMMLRDGTLARLHRVRFEDRSIDEDRLQQILFEHPELLPLGEIEPIFTELIAVARELPTAAGPVDLLYMTPEGYLAIVETKLWRNPDARRSVVAQIIDYTKDMARWSYSDLITAVQRVRSDLLGDPLVELVREAQDDDFDEAAFHDRVSRNLRLGRFLLLIVGDGIREDVEHMAEFLQQTPQLGFTLALIELALFRLDPRDDNRLFIQPRIVARTREVTRAIVEIRNRAGADIETSITLSESDSSDTGKRQPLTEQAFLSELGRHSPHVVEFAKWVLNEAQDKERELSVEWGGGGALIKYVDDETGYSFTFGQLSKWGRLSQVQRFARMCQKIGLPDTIAEEYLSALQSLIPDSKRFDDGVAKDGLRRLDVRMGPAAKKDRPPLELVAKNKEKWFDAIATAKKQIQEALENLET